MHEDTIAKVMTAQDNPDTKSARVLQRSVPFIILLAIIASFLSFNAWKGRRDAERHSLATDATLPYVTFEWVDEKRPEIQDILRSAGPRPKLVRETSEAYFVFKPRQSPEEPINSAVRIPKELVRKLHRETP